MVEGQLSKEFSERIHGYPERRLREQPKDFNVGVAGIDIEHDMKGFLKVILDAAKAEWQSIKYGDLSKADDCRQIIYKQAEWFAKHFGNVTSISAHADAAKDNIIVEYKCTPRLATKGNNTFYNEFIDMFTKDYGFTPTVKQLQQYMEWWVAEDKVPNLQKPNFKNVMDTIPRDAQS
jgi:hypothetical protein